MSAIMTTQHFKVASLPVAAAAFRLLFTVSCRSTFLQSVPRWIKQNPDRRSKKHWLIAMRSFCSALLRCSSPRMFAPALFFSFAREDSTVLQHKEMGRGQLPSRRADE
jgi:hypothetical protein